ncbi:hypothetical protein [Leptotrichia massiliensis]|jgi:hypothetical protein|uniref:hypothetical protein n=3 Tax=Leptotrichia TaxID=32067 RepID=UPI0028E2A1C7|nr:hypothetical protein [Leptotrichia massiliensis]
MKLWLFLVEGNSDKIYVDKIIKYYVKSEKLKKEIKLEWIILDGKYNYDKKEKQIKQKINKFKNQNKNSDYEIIYVIDLDKFKREEKDRIFLEDIKKFIQKNKYKLIKNNENIEMILKTDNKDKKEKVKIAERFIMEKSKEKHLNIEEPENVDIGSNIFKILDILESEV